MNRSIFSELWFKMVHSGSRVNLFIGINAVVFFAVGIIYVVEVLFLSRFGVTLWLENNLTLPAYLPALLYKPWSLITYMFLHRDFFHFLFNMLGLFWFGRIFEDFLNSRQFTFTYLMGGLFGGLLFIAFYNIFPAFQTSLYLATLLGASACVMAIVVAAATLLPDYTIRLLLLGDVQLKFLALFYVLINLVSIASTNAGGAIAHLGGALLGFIYIKQLRAGNDWSKIFDKRKKLKIIRNSSTSGRSSTSNTSAPD
jgi:membrane associated rhomboid family serine protease